MTTPFRHPTDDTLFDFVEGTLDAAREPELQRHLARCAACAAFVASARVGHARSTEAVEAMPEAAVASFDAAIDAIWDERVGATTRLAPVAVDNAAGELADDVAGPGDTIQLERVTPPARPRRAPATARPRRRFVRSAIPVFAVIVVGVLAGTSVYVDGLDSGDTSSAKRSTEQTEQSTTEDSGDYASEGPADLPAAAPEASIEGDAPETDSAARGTNQGAQTEVAPADEALTDGREGTAGGSVTSAPPETGIVGGMNEPDHEVCIATNDPSQLYLPEGRIPREVIDGPLGTFVVCG